MSHTLNIVSLDIYLTTRNFINLLKILWHYQSSDKHFVFTLKKKNLKQLQQLQSWEKIIWTTEKNGVVLDTKQCTTNFKEHLQGVKELYYIYGKIRYNESRVHYHEDGYLVPSPRYGFRFEALSRL